ncbi:hypothetical protein BJV82DRAFT_596989 [Fennellomyces sp. T-0311]|nr:hypothetical protein BJV82DRAFT_596989 [Fennellomyces sp. T-0311]
MQPPARFLLHIRSLPPSLSRERKHPFNSPGTFFFFSQDRTYANFREQLRRFRRASVIKKLSDLYHTIGRVPAV